MANRNLGAARLAKKDEFYTQWADIEREMNAYLEYDPDVFRGKTVLLPCDDPEWSNFTKYFALHFMNFGLKKLISTSYAPESNHGGVFYEPTLFETESPVYDADKSRTNGRVFTLTPEDFSGDGKINLDDLQWEYLEGDGDFRSKEVTALRDAADIVITNPPFSLLRDFIAWLYGSEVKFSLLANMNAITYKEVFPLISSNRLWLGSTHFNKGMYFGVPEEFEYSPTYNFEREIEGVRVARVAGICWFGNIDHGRRHEPLQLMTMEDNLKFNKKVKDVGYPIYENYDAIEVGWVDAIPSDYEGVMGVPITFLDKYNPDQFEILGNGQSTRDELGIKPVGQEFVDLYYEQGNKGQISASWNNLVYRIDGKVFVPYQRILIRARR